MSYTHEFKDSSNRMLLEGGDYKATITSVEPCLAKSSGNEMLKLTLEIEPHGVTVYDNLVFSAKAAWRIDTFLKSIGMAPKKGEKIDFNEAFCERLVGKSGEVTLSVDEYEPGKKSNKVTAWLTAVTGTF